ncbi:MAG: hypothetical protein JWN24_1856, partial [Phycisphaerales bacterium]|nr:hypothetical protein [Phycisphaerales bacterium]
RQNPIPPKGLEVSSIGRVLKEGQSTYKVQAQKLNIELGDPVERPA